MKTKRNLLAISVLLLALGLVMIGCGDDPGSEGDPLTGSVSITGFAKVGETLTANTSQLDGNGTISYQWQRSDSANGAYTTIEGATGDTYTPVAGDAGKYLKVTVARAGYTGSVSSERVGPVASANTATPTVSAVSVSGPDSVAKGGNATYTATVTGTNNPPQTVSWSIVATGKNAGTSISDSGVLTVAAGETLASITVEATSTINPSKSDTKTVAITGGGGGNSLVGSWEKGYNTLTFTETTWTFLFGDESGTYTLSGATLTMNTSAGNYTGTVAFSGSTVTFSGFTGMLGDEGFGLNGAWTKEAPSDITYTATADGTAAATTTKIDFVFSAAVTGLSADNIAISGTGAAIKGTLTGSGTNWSLPVTVTTAGQVTVTIGKTGVESAGKTVTLHKAGANNDTNLVGKWIGGDGEDQFEFAAETFVFTIADGYGTFSGSYTYTHATLRMACIITNATGYASGMVGDDYDINISWQDADNFTVTQVNSSSPMGGPTVGETWRRISNTSGNETAAMPAASPGAGAVSSGTTVSLSTSTGGAVIYYTTNGNTPTTSSTAYTSPIPITAATTIKAIAVKSGMTNSDVLTASYTIGGGVIDKDTLTGRWERTAGDRHYTFELNAGGEGYSISYSSGYIGGFRWTVSGSKVTCGMAFSDNIKPEDISFTFNAAISPGIKTINSTTMTISDFTEYEDGVIDDSPF
jgi:hypothetical protein